MNIQVSSKRAINSINKALDSLKVFTMKKSYKEIQSNPIVHTNVIQMNQLFANMVPGTYTPQEEYGMIDFSVDALG